MNWNKSWKKRMLAGGLAMVMSVTMEGNGILTVANAAEQASQKEEVVYCMLDSKGVVSGVYVVNSFTGGDIVDYGTYTNIKNLTTTDEIKAENGKITLHTDADKVYYQGDLETKEIPWKIDVTYKMDGKEYTAKEIAGMTGKAEVQISIKENKACDSSFWDGYALQAAITLNGDKCKKIVADGATIANVGSDKQLSYIILPGKGADLTITADVTEFEMSEISINGVKLNLDFDSAQFELGEDVEKLVDAIEELDNGAKELNKGAKELKDGMKELKEGSLEFRSGSKELSEGAKVLDEGIKMMQAGLDELNRQSGTLTEGSAQVLMALKSIQSSLNQAAVTSQDLSALSNASTQIKGGIDALTKGLQQMDGSIDAYYAALAQAGMTDIKVFLANHDAMITNLTKAMEIVPAEQKQMYQQMITLIRADKAYIEGSSQLIGGIDASIDSQKGQLMTGALTLQQSYAEFDKNIQTMVGGMGTLAESMTALKNGIDTLAANYEGLDSGINEYTKAVALMAEGYKQIVSGSKELAGGTNQLYKETKTLVNGTTKLYDGVSELTEGTEELSDGTSKIRKETKKMDTDMETTISETIDEMTGKEVEIKSFVSDKNSNVESVLFVMKVPPVEIPEEEVVEVEEKTENVWEKFLAIFK